MSVLTKRVVNKRKIILSSLFLSLLFFLCTLQLEGIVFFFFAVLCSNYCTKKRESFVQRRENFLTLLFLFFCRFFVDAFPIRVYKNNEAKGVAYPNSQPMGIYSTIWNADDWATRGGLEKIDWSRAPFYAYYKDIDIEACSTSDWLSHCSATASNWWDTPSYQQLGPVQARLYRWVRMNHMVYDYCSDKSRYPVPPPECLAGI
jgi:Xyloglucan endo-transglycosylase (XET) C-terminus/Glycosyl hydrolases family 16